MNVIDKEHGFKFYRTRRFLEVSTMLSYLMSKVGKQAWCFGRLEIMAPTMVLSKLESGESVTIYNPQRVLRQLGYSEFLGILSLRASWLQRC